MNINLEQYILNEIGDTSWWGDSEHDAQSEVNLMKLNNVLNDVENLRDHLLSLLYAHRNFNKGNASAESLHRIAKKIAKQHIIKEFTVDNFDEYWDGEDN